VKIRWDGRPNAELWAWSWRCIMAVIVIGGQSRQIGKTSVVAGIIAALPQYGWSAFKITQHRHELEPSGDLSSNGRPWEISEEMERSGRAGQTDTGRFLAAGAEHAFWVRTEPGQLKHAMPMVQSKLAEARNAIVESNSVMQFLQPDLYMVVIDPAIADFKASAQEFLYRADAVIVHGGRDNARTESIKDPAASPERTTFLITPPHYVTQEIIDFVKKKLR
jgi:hypothetical protein